MGRGNLWGQELSRLRDLSPQEMPEENPHLKPQVSESHRPVKFRFRFGAVMHPRNLESLERMGLLPEGDAVRNRWP